MSTPSPKDYTVLICHHVLYVDCILTGFIAYWSSNKILFCSVLKDHPSYMQLLVTVLHVIVFSKGSCIHVCHILVPNGTSFTFKFWPVLC